MFGELSPAGKKVSRDLPESDHPRIHRSNKIVLQNTDRETTHVHTPQQGAEKIDVITSRSE